LIVASFETEEGQIKDHARNIRTLQNDMIKLNTLLSSQNKKHGKLEEANLEIEQKFRSTLKVIVS
jgi:hypothetical protein